MTQAVLAQECLSSHGIESHVMNRRDSMYPMVGSVEIFVQAASVEQAFAILKAAGF